MPDNNSTRHKSSVALLLIDVINHFEFPDGDKILKNALPMANRLATLKQRCRRVGIPAIYVNDNFGHRIGDQMIKGVGSALRGMMRDFSGSLFRLGGDEFALLMQVTGIEELRARATQIIGAVRALRR